jgi:hypothetical protein
VRGRAADGADVYNVIVLDGKRRVDLWPTENHVRLPPPRAKRSASYSWFVYPGFREGSSIRYGTLLTYGKLEVRN